MINFCGNCGTENNLKANFCPNCGAKLINEETIIPIVSENEPEIIELRYIHFKEKLNFLIDHPGFLIVSVGECFIQFKKDSDRYVLIFDLGEAKNIPEVYIDALKSMRFIGIEGYLAKTVTLSYREKNINDIIQETKFIFETIFKSDPSEDFTFEEYTEELTVKPLNKSYPQTKSKNSGKAIFFVIIILIAMIGYCTRSNDSNSDKKEEKKEIVSNSEWDGSVHQVETYLKTKYLNDPDSYQGISWSKVQVYSDTTSTTKYMVRHEFRAKNQFGGYVTANKLFYLDKDGNVLSYTDFNLK